jgi:hypothetical protein
MGIAQWHTCLMVLSMKTCDFLVSDAGEAESNRSGQSGEN